jgi:hypothetical protein
MAPDFQRDFIWSPEQQSKLIESVLLRIPLPVCYLAEDEEGRLIVVDGLQRLSTFRNFVGNDLALRLPSRPKLNGLKFKDLNKRLQRRIEDCNLILYVIDSAAPERVRLDIFERVNSGVPLTRQQMRNCLYNGPATWFLKAKASSEGFIKATGGSVNVKTMRDRELVNRFCAFHLLGYSAYKGDMDDFLATALKEMNGFSEQKLSDLSSALEIGLTNNTILFGSQAFRTHTRGQTLRKAINALLWDVTTTIFAAVPTSFVQHKAEPIRSAFYDLLSDPEFLDALTHSPRSARKTLVRFDKAHQMFHESIDA